MGNQLNQNKEKIKSYQKSLLTFGIVANLTLLGYFKYTDFFIENINLALHTNLPLLHLALPLAISFFTFQQIAYLVDSYKGETTEYNFLNYALFVTFFPQLIAGPIVHHLEMMPQFSSRWNLIKKYKNIALGIFIFSIGLFKKVIIADTFALWANNGFDQSPILSFWEAWATSLSYTFELYFDFSGYTDMAIGVALLFNIRLPINFNSPYKSLDIQAFWRRWHITLSRFLKDYIYIPLGGNRKGTFRTYTNLLITFLLGGIWHGAGWTFVFWGFLHGLALVIHRIWAQIGFSMPRILAWFITFNFLNLSWVFFRAKSWDDALKVLYGMLHLSEIGETKKFIHISPQLVNPLSDYMKWSTASYTYLIILLGFILVLGFQNSNQLSKKFEAMKSVPLSWVVFTILLLGISLIFILANTHSEFLYFNF